MSSPYVYQHFESPGLFRLVELLSGTENEPLHIELHTYHLDKAPPFDALFVAFSYIPYSSEPDSRVICGGYEFRVRTNLYDILQSLRCARGSRLLWIDAISINQQDHDERYPSTDMMVYRAAVRTLVCITDVNIQSLKDFVKYTQQQKQYRKAELHLSQATDIFRSTSKITHQDLGEYEESVAQTQHSFDTSGVDELLKRKIFTRKLLLPCVVGSRRAVIAMFNRGKTWNEDEHTLSWTDLTNALLTCLLFDVKRTIQSFSLLSVLYAQFIRRKVHEGTINSFSDVLLDLYNLECNTKNWSDHIFMAYQLSQDLKLEGPDLAHEHNFNPYWYYLRTSIYLNSWSQQPLSLSLCNGFFLDSASWSPDWATYTTRLLLNHPASGFFAARNMRNKPESVDAETGIEDESGEWVCRGYRVDTIRTRSEEAMPPRRHCDHYAVADNAYFFTEWYETAKQHARKKTADEVLLEFTDTIQARGCGHVWEDPGTTAEDRIQQATKFFRFLEDPDEILSNEIRIFYAACFASHGRRFAVTRNGHFCLVPATSKEGDLVCIPLGSRVPYIFRQMRGKKTLNNVGEAYVHGIMQGEGYTVDVRDEQEFVLV